MTAAGGGRDEERRVEELLRVNAELAAEVRSLSLGRTDAPRSAQVPSTRRVARLGVELEETKRQLEEARSELAHLERHNGELRDLAEDRERQIAELRGGLAGLVRRLRMRLGSLRSR